MTKHQWRLQREANALFSLAEELNQWNAFNRFWYVEMWDRLKEEK
jgi:hypothetical protein